MDVMTAYCRNASDEELVGLGRQNLVESQARVVRAELEARGLGAVEVRPLADVLREHVEAMSRAL